MNNNTLRGVENPLAFRSERLCRNESSVTSLNLPNFIEVENTETSVSGSMRLYSYRNATFGCSISRRETIPMVFPKNQVDLHHTIDDNIPKSLEQEFCYVCQKIISMLTYTQKNYTSLHNFLYKSLGLNITLSSDQMSYVISKVNYLKKTFLMVNSRYNYVKNNVKKSDFFLKQNIEILKIIMSNISQNIEELEDALEQFKENSINEPIVYTPLQKENIEKGTWWITTLFNTYLKYGGKKDVSSMEFFNSIKDFWYKLEDEETEEISYITDKILGGISIDNIAINMRNWLRLNHNSLEIKYRYIVRLMA